MHEEKIKKIFTQDDLKCHDTSKFRTDLNQVQSYLPVKIKNSRFRIASGLLDIQALFSFIVRIGDGFFWPI